MKISGAIIQTRNIEVSTENEFRATYKGKQISITTDHGFGKPKYDHLKRFMIDVIDIETGMADVQTCEDLHEVKDAVRFALQGACLIS